MSRAEDAYEALLALVAAGPDEVRRVLDEYDAKDMAAAAGAELRGEVVSVGVEGGSVGFYGTPPIPIQTLTTDNPAAIVDALAALGLIIDNTHGGP